MLSFLLYLPLAALYGVFVTRLTHYQFAKLPIYQQNSRSLATLVVFGILGLAAYYSFKKKDYNYYNPTLGSGLGLGGGLLIVYAITKYWNAIPEGQKIVIFAGLFGFLAWYTYRVDDKTSEEEEVDISDIIPEETESEESSIESLE